VMPKTPEFVESVQHKLESVTVVVLLPLLFAFSGLRTSIGTVQGSVWIYAVVLIAVAILGKFGGSAVAARMTGIGWRDAASLGILMNTRGLMELIVLNIGLDIGVISQTVFTMMVLMALVTTFMTSPLLEWIYPLRLRTVEEKDQASRQVA
jgi:Kef-type K+ transport system membrane component KefB